LDRREKRAGANRAAKKARARETKVQRLAAQTARLAIERGEEMREIVILVIDPTDSRGFDLSVAGFMSQGGLTRGAAEARVQESIRHSDSWGIPTLGSTFLTREGAEEFLSEVIEDSLRLAWRSWLDGEPQEGHVRAIVLSHGVKMLEVPVVPGA
jgi:hypothetical protein